MSDKKSFWDFLPDTLKAKAKEVSEKLKEYKEYEAQFADAPPSANEGALKDGTPFKYTGDILDKGSIVTVVSDQGEVPMPPGEYVLPDDSTMVVAQQGADSVVAEIKAPAAEAMNNDAQNLADVKERVTKIVEKFNAFETAFNEVKSLKETIEKQKVQIENLKLKVGKQGALIVGLTEFNEAFGSVETAKPAEEPVVKKHRVDKLGFIK